MRCTSAVSRTISFLPSSDWLSGVPGVLACWMTPTYSEWSVTPIQSSGCLIFMSKPSACFSGLPFA